MSDLPTARARQIFQYLAELERLRHPPVLQIGQYSWTRRLNDLAALNLPEIQVGPGVGIGGLADAILTVRRPTGTCCPEPPEFLINRLRPGWENPEAAPHINSDPFEGDPERMRAQEWLAARSVWSQRVRFTLELFQELFELHLQLEREPEKWQLFLGDGMLHHWISPAGVIKHPVLQHPVELCYDAAVPEIVIRSSDRRVGLSQHLLAACPEIPARRVHELSVQLEGCRLNLMDQESTCGFLSRLMPLLWADGKLVDRVAGPSPQVVRDPILFLAPRGGSILRAIESYLGRLGDDSSLPGGLVWVAGSGLGDVEEVSFTGGASLEEAHRAGCVLGKVPSGVERKALIADLIGHFLADGKTVLVTGPRERALQGIRDLVVEPIRPLCLSSSTQEGDLREAVEAVLHRLATTCEQDLIATSARKMQERDRLRSELPPPGSSWIPGPVEPGPLPLSEEEIRGLYASNLALKGQQADLDGPLPDLAGLLRPDEFREICFELERHSSLQQADGYLWTSSARQSPDELTLVELDLRDCLARIELSPSWLLRCIDGGLQGGGPLLSLEQRIGALEESCRRLERLALEVESQGACLPEPLLWEPTIRALRAHVVERGSPGPLLLLLHPDWKLCLRVARVAAGAPSTLEHFKALEACVDFALELEVLRERWRRVVDGLGLTSPGGEVVSSALQYVARMRSALEWHETVWSPLMSRLSELGFQRELVGPLNDLAGLTAALRGEILPAVATRIASLRASQLRARLTLAKDRLAAGPQHPVGAELARGLDGSTELYERAFERLLHLNDLRAIQNERQGLLDRLQASAPTWARMIAQREGPHGDPSPPGPVGQAWLQAQSASRQPGDTDLQRTSIDLLAALAWLAQIRRIGVEDKRAIQEWSELERKCASAVGGRVTDLRVESRAKLKEFRGVLPVWIMTLPQAMETFHPGADLFDVVVIVEADQCDVTALAALTLASRVLLLGGAEPPGRLANLEQAGELIARYLADVPDARLYDPSRSLLELARHSLGDNEGGDNESLGDDESQATTSFTKSDGLEDFLGSVLGERWSKLQDHSLELEPLASEEREQILAHAVVGEILARVDHELLDSGGLIGVESLLELVDHRSWLTRLVPLLRDDLFLLSSGLAERSWLAETVDEIAREFPAPVFLARVQHELTDRTGMRMDESERVLFERLGATRAVIDDRGVLVSYPGEQQTLESRLGAIRFVLPDLDIDELWKVYQEAFPTTGESKEEVLGAETAERLGAVLAEVAAEHPCPLLLDVVKDAVIKRLGFRVPPERIEACLYDEMGATSAVVEDEEILVSYDGVETTSDRVNALLLVCPELSAGSLWELYCETYPDAEESERQVRAMIDSEGPPDELSLLVSSSGKAWSYQETYRDAEEEEPEVLEALAELTGRRPPGPVPVPGPAATAASVAPGIPHCPFCFERLKPGRQPLHSCPWCQERSTADTEVPLPVVLCSNCRTQVVVDGNQGDVCPSCFETLPLELIDRAEFRSWLRGALQPLALPIEQLGLTPAFRNNLLANEITSLAGLMSLNGSQVLELRGVGMRSWKELTRLLLGLFPVGNERRPEVEDFLRSRTERRHLRKPLPLAPVPLTDLDFRGLPVSWLGLGREQVERLHVPTLGLLFAQNALVRLGPADRLQAQSRLLELFSRLYPDKHGPQRAELTRLLGLERSQPAQPAPAVPAEIEPRTLVEAARRALERHKKPVHLAVLLGDLRSKFDGLTRARLRAELEPAEGIVLHAFDDLVGLPEWGARGLLEAVRWRWSAIASEAKEVDLGRRPPWPRHAWQLVHQVAEERGDLSTLWMTEKYLLGSEHLSTAEKSTAPGSSPEPPVVIQALEQAGQPLPVLKLAEKLRITVSNVWAQAAVNPELVRYPFGLRNWVGLSGWGQTGYERAAVSSWSVTGPHVQRVLHGTEPNDLDLIAWRAVCSVGKDDWSEWENQAAAKILEELERKEEATCRHN